MKDIDEEHGLWSLMQSKVAELKASLHHWQVIHSLDSMWLQRILLPKQTE